MVMPAFLTHTYTWHKTDQRDLDEEHHKEGGTVKLLPGKQHERGALRGWRRLRCAGLACLGRQMHCKRPLSDLIVPVAAPV